MTTMTLDLGPVAAETARIVTGIREDQLSGPTPCTDLPVAAVLHHLLTLSIAFRGAAEKVPQGPGPEPDATRLPPHWRERLPRHLDALATAWRDPSAWESSTEIAGMTMSASDVGVVALNEVLVHGWDVAAATGQEYRSDDDAVRACLEFARRIAADSPAMRDAMYAPAVPVADDAPLLDRLLGATGRDPRWPAH
jgi:uncharacterized protein (TIGR03086 family)